MAKAKAPEKRTEKQAALEKALLEQAINALRDASPGDIPLETLRSLGQTTGENDDLQGEAYEKEDDQLVTVYNTYTHEPSVILVSMLSKTMGKTFTKVHVEVPRRLWGTRVFDLKQHGKPMRGTMLCMFHADHPMREEIDAAGLKGFACPKHNMPNQQSVLLHAMHRHPSAWLVIKTARDEIEKVEERDFRRTMMKLALAGATAGEK